MEQKRKLRAVIADDERHIRMLLKAVLIKMNCEIIGEAVNGQEAVDLFKKEKPDMLLLDINMPVKTGIEALQEVIVDSPDAFVIILSSVADLESVKHSLELGAANYILKDTPLEEIKRIIKETWDEFRQKQKGDKRDA
jgi:two-component system, chemotaxis family, chemotaxis protein CheY